MTKDALRIYLKSGKTMDELFHYIGGQDCLIYKAKSFIPGNEIIYIPDISLNEIPMDRPMKKHEGIEDVLCSCYTGDDFLAECKGDLDLAKHLFDYCDWQHPSSALPEISQDEDIGEAGHKIAITIFQAPYASLLEHGFYVKMCDYAYGRPYDGVVPAEYYLTVFHGEIEYVGSLPDDSEARIKTLLEYVFCTFNSNHPSGYCGRSLSVGDVVRLEGHHYLCASSGFTEVDFATESQGSSTAMPKAIELVLPSGIKLRATTHPASDHPCITIDMVDANEILEQLCFVEHSPQKGSGQELCIGVYCSSDENPVYYGSYYSKVSD